MTFLSLIAVVCALANISHASNDCLRQYGSSLAEFSSCGDSDAIASCLLHFRRDNHGDVSRCFTNAGCSTDEAEDEVVLALRRCRKLAKMRKIRKRATTTDDSDNTTADDKATTKEESSAEKTTSVKTTAKETTTVKTTAKETTTEEETTTEQKSTTKASSTKESSTSALPSSTEAVTTTEASSSAASSTSADSTTGASSTIASSTTAPSAASATTGGPMSGTMCFTTHTKMTEFCDVHTTGGKTETATCTEGEIKSSECASGLLCTTDAGGGDICMKKEGMKTEGTVIAIVFGVSIFAIFGYIFFACFRGSRREKAASDKAKAKDASMASLIPK